MSATHKVLDGITTLNTQYDILVMGGKNVGKTSLIYKFLGLLAPAETHENTDELHAKMVDMNWLLKLTTCASSVSSTFEEITILDASSSAESYASHKSRQVCNAQTIMFVYALDNRDSFEALEYMMEGVMVMRNHQLPPFVVAGLKLDIHSEYQVLYSEGQELAVRFGALKFAEVSLRSDDEVNNIFHLLVQEALKMRSEQYGLDERLSQYSADCSKDSSSKASTTPCTEAALIDSTIVAEPPCETIQEAHECGSPQDTNSTDSQEKLPHSTGSPAYSSRETAVVSRSKNISKGTESRKAKSGCCIIM